MDQSKERHDKSERQSGNTVSGHLLKYRWNTPCTGKEEIKRKGRTVLRKALMWNWSSCPRDLAKHSQAVKRIDLWPGMSRRVFSWGVGGGKVNLTSLVIFFYHLSIFFLYQPTYKHWKQLPRLLSYFPLSPSLRPTHWVLFDHRRINVGPVFLLSPLFWSSHHPCLLRVLFRQDILPYCLHKTGKKRLVTFKYFLFTIH